jgi:uncharacterized protein YjbJ (UPF0337 family)
MVYRREIWQENPHKRYGLAKIAQSTRDSRLNFPPWSDDAEMQNRVRQHVGSTTGFCPIPLNASLCQVLTKIVFIFHAQENAAFAATRRRTVNKDQVSGKVEQAVGKVKQSVGETVGNEKLANQGVVDQAKGAAKETWGNAKDAAKEVQQSHKDAATDKAHETRDKMSQSVQNAKEKVNEKIDKFKERHSA